MYPSDRKVYNGEKMRNQAEEQPKKHSAIPDIDIIDLEESDEILPADESQEEYPNEDDSKKNTRKRGFHFYMHIAMLTVVLLVIITVVYRVKHWGAFISQDDIFQNGEEVEDYADILDSIFPVEDENGNIQPPDHDGNGLTILALGNAPFADDADSEDSLASMIEDLTGGTVINCAVSGSYAASKMPSLSPDDAPMDAYTPYWLCLLSIFSEREQRFYKAVADVMGDDLPPEGEYVFETLSALDLNTVDVVVFMYDATDYLMNHPMYSNEYSMDIQKYTGNLEAAFDVLQSHYPHLRIIVLSPTYAFAVDDNGEYVSSDVKRNDYDVLSSYSISLGYSCNMRRVTFVDNLYGTITEDNATEYLKDNLHLNIEGRKLVAERFVYALNFYEP